MRNRLKLLLLEGAYKTGAYRTIPAKIGGIGTVLMLHRVVEKKQDTPARYLTITTQFLEDVIVKLKADGTVFVSLDDLKGLLGSERAPKGRFVCLTFDDGYRDNLTLGLPLLRKHNVPAAIYVPSGAPDRDMDVWFLRLERILLTFDHIDFVIPSVSRTISLRTSDEKAAAYEFIIDIAYRNLGAVKECLFTLLPEHAVSDKQLMEEHFLSWDELRFLSQDPLITIGGHTVKHPMLANVDEETARHEMSFGRKRLEEELGRKIQHFAYPFGSPLACGVREFDLAREVGFETATTTRYGNIHQAHRDHLSCLPRMNLGGPKESVSDVVMDVYGLRTLMSKKALNPVVTV